MLSLGLPFMKLKAGRWRAVTVHDTTASDTDDPDYPWSGIVWLCGVGYRKEGDADDAYNDFAALGRMRLLPERADLEDLYADIRSIAAAAIRTELAGAVELLLEAARADPNALHRTEVDPGFGIAVRVFDRHGYRILVLPAIDRRRHPVSEEVQTVIIQAVFPGVRLEFLESPDANLVADISGYRLGIEEYALSFRYRFP